MTPASRLLTVSAIAAGALLFTGCTPSTPPAAPTSTADSGASATPEQPVGDEGFDAVWLDEGRLVGIVSWGSSMCVPVVDTMTADGQKVAVTFVEGESEEVACTADYAARVSLGALPEGVDVSQDVELSITLGDVTDDADLDGDSTLAAPGSATGYLPSASWVDDGLLVLLTWGSSTCPPVVDSVDGAGAAGTVTFVTDDSQVCTMDMAPRTTLIGFDDGQVEDDDFILTLVGGALDGTVAVRD